MDIQAEYNTLRKKFRSLPDFEQLDAEFEISAIENHPKFLLREIRKKMTEKLEYLAEVLEGLLQPEATMANLQESKDFTNKEKQEMYELYKKLMIASRSSLEHGLTGNDRDNAEFISEVMKDWGKTKEHMLFFVRKMKHSWSKSLHVEGEQSYFG